MSEAVWVELDAAGTAVQIFKNAKYAAAFTGVVALADRALATEQIRLKIFAKYDNACTHCGTPVTWKTGHMHERLWRGRGGEISVGNSTLLCDNCHQNDPIAGHGKRRPQFHVNSKV